MTTADWTVLFIGLAMCVILISSMFIVQGVVDGFRDSTQRILDHSRETLKSLLEERRWQASGSVEAKLVDAVKDHLMSLSASVDSVTEKTLQFSEEGRQVLKMQQELKIAETNLQEMRHNHTLAMRALARQDYGPSVERPEVPEPKGEPGEMTATFDLGRATKATDV